MRSNWLAVVITITAGALLATAYVNLVNLQWPRRIAVCDGGLVMVVRHGRVLAAPWAVVSAAIVPRPGAGAAFEVSIQTNDGVEVVELGSYTGRAALISSVVKRRPVPISPWPRVVAAVVVAALAGLAGGAAPVRCTRGVRAAQHRGPARRCVQRSWGGLHLCGRVCRAAAARAARGASRRTRPPESAGHIVVVCGGRRFDPAHRLCGTVRRRRPDWRFLRAVRIFCVHMRTLGGPCGCLPTRPPCASEAHEYWL